MPSPPGSEARIGPYRLLDRLAVGGMAEVHRALFSPGAGAERAVVVKRLLPELLAISECVSMFEDEARLGERISHPNVVQVLSSGIHEGAPYLALEYVFGVDLHCLLRHLRLTGQALSPPLSLFIATRLLAGLGAVHAATDAEGRPLGVVHRDVSPSNVFLSVHGEVKLGDLGIARALLRERGTKRARDDGARGKLGYLAPEQLGDGVVDSRADIFAAAALTAELLMGQPLFSGPSELSVLLAVRDADISAFAHRAAELPEDLRSALEAALRRDPDHRTSTAEELRIALEPFVNEPAKHLASELGALVRRAHEASRDTSEPRERSSLARTVEADAHMLLALSPGELSRTPTPRVTLDPNGPTASIYEVEREGAPSKPYSYASLVAALVGGEVDVHARVSVNGGEARPAHRIPEMVRHLLPSTREPALGRARLGDTSELFDLSVTPATEVFGYAYRMRFSGLAVFELESRRKEVHFVQGTPVRVASSAREELLGQRLVADGTLSEGELSLALAMMPRYEGRLGDTLLALGLLTPMTLFRALSRQARERLGEVNEWAAGRAALYGELELRPRGFPIEVQPIEFLRDGLVRRAGAGLPLFAPPWSGARLGAEPWPHGVTALSPELEALRTRFATPLRVAAFTEDPTMNSIEVALLLSLGALRWVA